MVSSVAGLRERGVSRLMAPLLICMKGLHLA
jgi:hypothetical protein